MTTKVAHIVKIIAIATDNRLTDSEWETLSVCLSDLANAKIKAQTVAMLIEQANVAIDNSLQRK
jgi:hypothetical protein